MMLFGQEAVVALVMLVFIVFLTLSGAKKHPRPLRAPPEHPSRLGQTAKPAESTGAEPKDSQPPKADAS
jgi:hypothetical protein